MIALNPGRLQLNDRNSPLITLLILIGLTTEVSVKAGSPFDDGDPYANYTPFEICQAYINGDPDIKDDLPTEDFSQCSSYQW
jgi:hypothetical protein